MFPKGKRLSRDEFPLALKEGRRFSSKNLSILVPRRGEGYAVVVSKKVATLAVTRHAIKRKIVSALTNVPLPKSLIVFPKSSVIAVHYKDLRQEIEALIKTI